MVMPNAESNSILPKANFAGTDALRMVWGIAYFIKHILDGYMIDYPEIGEFMKKLS